MGNALLLDNIYKVYSQTKKYTTTYVYMLRCNNKQSKLLSNYRVWLAGDFIYKVSTESPTRHFVIHSRKAFLKGLSPADNRKIPPLKYV